MCNHYHFTLFPVCERATGEILDICIQDGFHFGLTISFYSQTFKKLTFPHKFPGQWLKL